ncbi:peptidylprolyl isomerase [Sphingomonas sp.]|jgi:peptidylprolyl isomerase|uniref:peptidylprolyl isomerase n=1 Tax=Sphingomonas sp. TaxID=28214 RepID=UPI002ED9E78F
MRFVAILAALAAALAVSPALAQGGGPPQKVPAEPLRGVAADPVVAKPLPAVVPADPENTWVLDLSSGGRVLIRLRPDAAPLMVERIKTLTRRKFYNGVTFHRVLDDPYPIAQGGDPTGTGTGDSDLPDVPAEFNSLPHLRGTVSAARQGAPEGASPELVKAAENSANSQFYVMLRPLLVFDHNYTVFGRVISGMEWVDLIQRGEPPANPTRILQAYILSDNPPPYQAPAAAAARALPEGETKATLVP